MDDLLKKLGVSFHDHDLLHRALTHASADSGNNYERLEFLGDRVLGLVMAHFLYETFPDEPEGHLAKRHAALVQGKTLAQVAREIDLGAYIHLSDAERTTGGDRNENILADVMEAIIGALYLDSGLAPCAALIKHLWGERVHVLRKPPRDPKTALQEWAQGRGLPLPVYEEIKRTGPDHAPEFTIEVSVAGHESEQARGNSRRTAEKKAAELLLERLEKGVRS